MSGSTTNLDTIQASQAQHDVVANALIDAASPSTLFGRRASTTAALTWGYYGGTMAVASVPTVLTNGTVALTASTTNYVYTTSGGVVTQTTSAPTGWPGPITSPAGAIALYQIVTGTATVTSYIDYRTTAVATGGGGAPTGPAGGDLTGTYPNPTIGTNAVTNAKAAQMAAHTFKGNNTASTANAIDLTLAQATAEINAMVGDSGAGGTKGQVPAPAAGDAAALKFLKADGTWAVQSGGAPADATYITANANASLTHEQVLTAGSGITLTPSGGSPPSTLTIAATSSKTFQVAISDETTTITTGVAKLTFRMPFAMTLTGVRASLNAASSSGLPQFDINETSAGSPASPVSILSTKITIDVGERTSTTAATQPVISDSALADDAEITIDIDTAGTGAKGAKITFIGT